MFTTGGTGLTADDVTPEATRDVIEREAPGYAEAIRADSREHTPLGILTRGVSGMRGRTLIVNFPGNPKAIDQSWPVVAPTLEHAAETLASASASGSLRQPLARSSSPPRSASPSPLEAHARRARRRRLRELDVAVLDDLRRGCPTGRGSRARGRAGSRRRPPERARGAPRLSSTTSPKWRSVVRRPGRGPPRARGTGRPCRGTPSRGRGRAARTRRCGRRSRAPRRVAHLEGDVVDPYHPSHLLSLRPTR